MKRDLRLIKSILLFVEENIVDRSSWISSKKIESAFIGVCEHFNFAFVRFHIELIKDAGFYLQDENETKYIKIKRLTWKGCEELDRLRDRSDLISYEPIRDTEGKTP